MGLDIYVGTLTRYMAGDWETVVQQWARETGQDFRVVRTNPEPEDAITDPGVILELVEDWRSVVGEALGQTLDWNEAPEAPDFTDKPGWDSFGSVQVLAARVELAEAATPEVRVTDWSSDEGWQRASQADDSKYAHLYLPEELWVPLEVPVFQTMAP